MSNQQDKSLPSCDLSWRSQTLFWSCPWMRVHPYILAGVAYHTSPSRLSLVLWKVHHALPFHLVYYMQWVNVTMVNLSIGLLHELKLNKTLCWQKAFACVVLGHDWFISCIQPTNCQPSQLSFHVTTDVFMLVYLHMSVSSEEWGLVNSNSTITILIATPSYLVARF